MAFRLMPSIVTRAAIPLAVAGAVALVALAPPLAHADVATTTADPAPAAAGWLARQMTDGKFLAGQFGPDAGLSIDGILALAAAGVGAGNAHAAIGWLDDPAIVASYSGDGTAEVYANPTAKLILAATVTGSDPTSFGGRDLVAQLLSRQGASGRLTDKSAFGDFANALGHALAVIGLQRSGHPAEAAKTAAFLAGTQCTDGGFPLSFDESTCDSEVDSTAFAVQALLATGHADVAAGALDWLAGVQHPDGGFGDESKNNLPENANSTGVAAQALRVGGRTTAAGQAVAYLTSLQIGCAGPAPQRGAIAYDRLDPAHPDDTGYQAGNAVRATAQGILGLTGIGLKDLTISTAASGIPSLACVESTPTSGSTALATPSAAANGVVLPVTGASLPPLVFGGVGLIVAGAGLLVLLRRRRRAVDA